MGIFDKKQSISKQELKSVFKKDRGMIPKTGGKKYFQREREKMIEEIFRPKYGSQISKQDYRRAIRDLESAKKNFKTPNEKSVLEEKIRYLKESGGKLIR